MITLLIFTLFLLNKQTKKKTGEKIKVRKIGSFQLFLLAGCKLWDLNSRFPEGLKNIVDFPLQTENEGKVAVFLLSYIILHTKTFLLWTSPV